MPRINASPIDRSQALHSVLQSIALQETALAHILNADGEKIQVAAKLSDPFTGTLGTSTPKDFLLDVNDSVSLSMDHVNDMEAMLRGKLNSVLGYMYPGMTFAEIPASIRFYVEGSYLSRFRVMKEVPPITRADDEAIWAVMIDSIGPNESGLLRLTLTDGVYQIIQIIDANGDPIGDEDQVKTDIVVKKGTYTINGSSVRGTYVLTDPTYTPGGGGGGGGGYRGPGGGTAIPRPVPAPSNDPPPAPTYVQPQSQPQSQPQTQDAAQTRAIPVTLHMVNANTNRPLANGRVGVQGFVQSAEGSYPVDFEAVADADGYVAFHMPTGSVGSFTFWQADPATGQVIASESHTVDTNDTATTTPATIRLGS
jgi:hypothetical protein